MSRGADSLRKGKELERKATRLAKWAMVFLRSVYTAVPLHKNRATGATMTFNLRPYQQFAEKEARGALAGGAKRVALYLPVGAR